MSKKLTALILIFVLCFSACSGARTDVKTPSDAEATEQFSENTYGDGFIGAWISYIEIKSACESEQTFTDFLALMLDNFERVGVTDVFFHVRPFADAVYPSELFPSSSAVCESQGDELKLDYLNVALREVVSRGMRLHAWINPYRVSSDADVNKLADTNKAKQWYAENSGRVFEVGSKLWLNPADNEVQNLVTDGVRELLELYPGLSGIHIDDYFYPAELSDEDEAFYESYTASGGRLSLSEWRRENVTNLVSSLYRTVKQFGADKLFSISPSGKVDDCMNVSCADVELWCSSEGYCDMILPQIYFGFENEAQPFNTCLSRWKSLCKGGSVRLIPALALYKCGSEDPYAGEKGKREWLDNSDIIKRQVLEIKREGLEGFSLYSGSYVNFSISFYEKELENLMSVL